MHLLRLVPVLALLLSAILVAPASARLSAADCLFRAGFQELHDLIPDVVGDCLADESHDPVSGDTIQPTTNGMLVWRQADNWTAFTDGATTWINGPCGLQSRSNDDRFPWEQGGTCVVRFDEVSSVATARPVLALTFDAGWDDGATLQTLDALRDAGVRSTFFLVGEWAEQYPDLVRRMLEDGHELANHSYSHPYFTQIGDAAIHFEMAHTDEVLRQFSGKTTKPLMRMPYGDRDARVIQVVAAAGYRSIYWSVDALDWTGTPTAASVTQRVLAGARPGAIVVQHCAVGATAESIPAIMAGLAERGLTPVLVSDLLRDEQ